MSAEQVEQWKEKVAQERAALFGTSHTKKLHLPYRHQRAIANVSNIGKIEYDLDINDVFDRSDMYSKPADPKSIAAWNDGKPHE